MKKLSVIFAAFFVFSVAVFPQSAARGNVDQSFLNDFVRTNWTTADGLPGMTITDIIQDKKGYIYIGTYDGLVRFDGVEFVNFARTEDAKYDFASVRAIYQDTAGNLWVGHNDEGVTRMMESGEMKKFDTQDGLPHNSVRAICEDAEGNIWLGTSAGLCYITPAETVLFPEGLKELGEENIQVSKLYCDTVGRVWISTSIPNELYVCTNKKVERFTGITKIKNPSVNEVTQAPDGAFWFGVSPHYAVRIKGEDETVYDISHDHQEGIVVNSIITDKNGNIWFASDSGLTVLHDGLYTYYDKRNGIPDDYINKIFSDREGNIWLAYNRGGIEKMSSGKFRTTAMPVPVNAIAQDSFRKCTWIGADDGIYCFKENKFEENAITDFLKGLRVRHVEFTADNELLVSTYAEKTQVRITAQDEITVWSVKDGLPGLRARVAKKISNGDYYLGTTQGLSIIDHTDGSFTNITKDNGLKNEFIMCLYEDSEGNIWVGTDGAGLYILKDKKIVGHLGSEDGLAGNVIFKLTEIEGSLWICTGTGLSKYNKADKSIFNFNSQNGLGTDGVFQMLCDYTNTVWLTTNKGVTSVELSDMEKVAAGEMKTLPIKIYGVSDGLVSGGVTATSLSATDAAGRVWFTMIDGFAIYDPVKAKENLIAPEIEIQEYSIDSVHYDYHGEAIVLPPSAKRVSIKFTGLSFISSERIKFCYKLDGFEQSYSEWSGQRTVSYTNLKPKTYRFTLMSQNGDGVQSSESFPVTIIKKPYVWQLTWFWVLSVLLVLGVAVLIVWLKILSMKRYQIKLEKTVEERTHDLKLEKEKSEKLLLNILPQDVAKELTDNPGKTIAKKYPAITVLFTDIVGFTKMSDHMSAEEVVTMLNRMISKFDERALKEGIEKIKTIGDAYMAATGFDREDEGAAGVAKMVRFAQGLISDVNEFNRNANVQIQIRLGINTGNLVAGVIGKSKFIYDIWGDTVNVASRMESTGEAMRIHVTESAYNATKDLFGYSEGIEVEVKGKGKMKTYFL